MKKILLSLMCLVGFMAANAAEVAFVAQGATYDGAGATVTLPTGDLPGTTFTADDMSLLFTKVNNSTSNVNSGGHVRWYKSDVITLTPNAGVTIKGVTFAVTASSYALDLTASTGTVAVSTADKTITWSGEATEALTLTASAGQVRFYYMEVTYEVGVATSVSTPIITPNGGEALANTEISITCATDGASIYYTIDGTEPSATNGTLYSAPFTLTSAATVKAIAVDPTGKLSASAVAEAEFTAPVANIAEFISVANAHATTITGTVTVVAQAGSYLFIQDETCRIVAYGSLNNTYKNGDQLTNIKGKYSPYNGLPELMVEASSFGVATAGAAVEPEVVTIEEVAIDNLLAYVKLTGVTISGTDKSYTIEDETGSMTMYNSAGITVPTGENMTVIGFISCYNTTVQILPVEITSASGLEVVETPEITPAGGAITSTQDITITCATEGASIYFTIDGTEPSETNGTLYSTPFILGKECTVKAIAYADGMEASAVAEAAFTLLSDDVKVATFDFTNPASLNPVQETPAAGGAVVVNDITFTSGDISLVCVKGESASTDCRLYLSSSAGAVVDLRTYTTSTITISGESVNITSIEFTGSKASDAQLTPDIGTLTDKVWMSADSANQVVFTTTATTNIQTIKVYYEGATDGIESIEDDFDNNAPIEYYNLQGVKIVNPENGLYIKVQGDKVSKVLVK